MESSRRKVLVMLSGGCESTSYLCQAVKAGHDVSALHVCFSNHSQQELEACEFICEALNVHLDIFEFGDNPSSSHVNQIQDTWYWLMPAIIEAAKRDVDEVWFGIHGDDNIPQMYEVEDLFSEGLKLTGHYPKTSLVAPWWNLSKQELYNRIDVDIRPYIVYCTLNEGMPCEECGKCREWQKFVKDAEQKVH